MVEQVMSMTPEQLALFKSALEKKLSEKDNSSLTSAPDCRDKTRHEG